MNSELIVRIVCSILFLIFRASGRVKLARHLAAKVRDTHDVNILA